MAENVLQSTGVIDPVLGTGGVAAQVPGQMASVSGAAAATGGIAAGNFIEADIDKELFQFNSDDTPLMQLMLSSKKVVVDSPKVTHFMVDEPRAALEVASNVTAQNAAGPVVLPLADADKSIPQEHTTLLV